MTLEELTSQKVIAMEEFLYEISSIRPEKVLKLEYIDISLEAMT